MDTRMVVRSLFLARGSALRIRHGCGISVRAASGVLWITEQGRADDVVLQAGEAIELTRPGCAIASAWQASRVIVSLPAALLARASIEVASTDGSEGAERTVSVWPRPEPLLRRILARLGNAREAVRARVLSLHASVLF